MTDKDEKIAQLRSALEKVIAEENEANEKVANLEAELAKVRAQRDHYYSLYQSNDCYDD